MLDRETMRKYASQMDYNAKALADSIEAQREISRTLKEMHDSEVRSLSRQVEELNQSFKVLVKQLERAGLPRFDTYEMQMQSIKEKLEGIVWPVAIDPDMLDRSDEDKAESVIELLVTEYLEGLKFLDYGCGTGHVVKAAAARGAKLSVGYDEKQTWDFASDTTSLFTENFEEVKANAPYDAILLYDVLDHCVNPEETLQRVKQVLSSKGRVYIRCHPWCSRHGGHLHHRINKAYLHLILDHTELTRIGGYECKRTSKIVKPLATYRKWFESTGFEVIQEFPIDSEPEDFFMTDPVIADRLEKYWNNEFYKEHMAIQFVDYVLEPKEAKRRIL